MASQTRHRNKELLRDQRNLEQKRKGSEKDFALLSALQEATNVVSGYKRVLAPGSATCLPLMIREPAEAQTQSISMQMALNILLIHRKPALWQQ